MRLTGLAQMDVNINESRCDNEALGVKGFIGLAAQLARRRDFSDASVFEQEIVFAFNVGRGVDEKAVANCETGIFQSKTYLAAVKISN